MPSEHHFPEGEADTSTGIQGLMTSPAVSVAAHLPISA